VIVCAACHAAPSDAPDAVVVPDAKPIQGSMVSVTKSGLLSGTQTIAISPTHEGDNVVVLVARAGGSAATKGVKIGGHVYVDLDGTPAVPCGAKTELWYDGFILGIDGGEAQVTVTRADASLYAVDVVELAGVNDFFDWQPGAPKPPQATAPSIPVDPGFVVLSTLATCGNGAALAPGSPFTAIDTDDLGTSAAYYIPTATGSYGAAWTYAGADWTSASLALD
jgi:hypothetical protein